MVSEHPPTDSGGFFVNSFDFERMFEMKHLLFIFCFIGAGAAFAETWNCGPATNGVYSDSVKCTYNEISKTLTISGEGEMGDYVKDIYTPWQGKDIRHAVVEGNVTSIGNRVFHNLHNLSDVSGLENITKIGNSAFAYTYSLKNLFLPNVQEIGSRAFKGTRLLEYIELPEDVVFSEDEFGGGETPFQNSKIPNCHKTGECWSCGEKFVQAGVGCVSSCPEGYTSYYGFCTRTRYTLPEADAATSDDNENTIEWIFE